MKKVAAIAVLCAVVGSGAFGETIAWNSYGNLGSGFTAGWLVELVEDVGKTGIHLGGGAGSGMELYDDGTTGSDDTLLGNQWTIAANPFTGSLYFGSSFSSPADAIAVGDHVYTIIYNASTFAAADQYFVLGSTYQTPNPAAPGTYSIDGAAAAAAGSWAPIVPVPEPGSIALFALGLVTLVARRKRRG